MCSVLYYNSGQNFLYFLRLYQHPHLLIPILNLRITTPQIIRMFRHTTILVPALSHKCPFNRPLLILCKFTHQRLHHSFCRISLKTCYVLQCLLIINLCQINSVILNCCQHLFTNFDFICLSGTCLCHKLIKSKNQVFKTNHIQNYDLSFCLICY